MRMSCNGCRVLRKGCSENCTIRPCLVWIKSPEAQANVTVFLAKFYGRAGLLNLINAGPAHLRPSVFRSLLYEACGRILNPIYGSVGLLWSGRWSLCQAAVEGVMKGTPITPITCESPVCGPCDIRHVAKRGARAKKVEVLGSNESSASHQSVGSSESMEEAEVGLDLTLRLDPAPGQVSLIPMKKRRQEAKCFVSLGLAMSEDEQVPAMTS